MKNIVHIVGAMNLGGTETMLMNLFRNIDRSKYKFYFITYTNQACYYDKEITELGGVIYQVKSPYNFFSLRRVFSKIGTIDSLHLHTYFSCGLSALYGKALGVNNIISHSHTNFDISGSLFNKAYQHVSQVLINKCSTKLAACSEDSARQLFGKVNDFLYIPNFVEPDKFIQAERVNLSGVPNDKIIVGHVGRFVPEKNHDFILKCAEYARAQNLPLHFVLVGDGEGFEKISVHVSKNKLSAQVTLLGLRSDVPNLMKSFDKFILPSITEGFGLVLVEAQVCGKECIVSTKIQNEAILDLGLVTKLDYDEGQWCEQLMKPASIQLTEHDILAALSEAKMDLDSTIKLFEELYEN